MKYMGSKRRLVKKILPIILKEAEELGYNKWIEPFVGGGNLICEVPATYTRIGGDISLHTIVALTAIRDQAHFLPDNIMEDDYNKLKGTPPNPITSWVRFVCAFGGIFEHTFARDKEGKRNYCKEGKNSALKQSPKLQGVILECCKYTYYSDVKNSIIYLDPPYREKTDYKTKFDYFEFWGWCKMMAKKGNLVYVSEYEAPKDSKIVCVGQFEFETNFASQRKKATNVVEKLFKVLP